MCLSVSLNRLLEQHWLSSSTQNPTALEYLRKLEASKSLNLEKEDVAETDFNAPLIVQHINDNSCVEGETAHFECKVEPKDDPALEIGIYYFLLASPV